MNIRPPSKECEVRALPREAEEVVAPTLARPAAARPLAEEAVASPLARPAAARPLAEEAVASPYGWQGHCALQVVA
jgi:hypothetical protein